MSTQLLEVMPELFTRSEVIIWNFAEITDVDNNKNILQYMQDQESRGNDPNDAFHQQEFTEQALDHTDSRYLIGRYGEDRREILKDTHITKEAVNFYISVFPDSEIISTMYYPTEGSLDLPLRKNTLRVWKKLLIFR